MIGNIVVIVTSDAPLRVPVLAAVVCVVDDLDLGWQDRAAVD